MMHVWELSRGIDMNNVLCVFCKTQKDSHDHLFFECVFPKQVRKLAAPFARLNGECFNFQVVEILEPMATRNSIWGIIARLTFGACVYFVWQ